MKSWWAIGLSLGAIAGCSKSHDIVGSWKMFETSDNVKSESTITFSRSGSYTAETTVGIGPKKLVATDTGTWRMEGNKVAIHFSDVAWQFVGLDNKTEKRLRDKFLSQKAEIMRSSNAEKPSDVEWLSDNEIKITGAAYRDRYRRVN